MISPRRLSLSLRWLLVVACVGHPIAAQARNSSTAGVHPYIADVTAFPPAGAHQGQGSPLFNLPDGIWNFGEGFAPPGAATHADYGGWLGKDDGQYLEAGDIRVVSGWSRHTNNSLTCQRFVGALIPQEVVAAMPPVDATFEVFAPTTFQPGLPLVLAVVTWGTTVPLKDNLGGLFAYPARCRQVRVASVSGVGWKRRLACRDRGESDVVARGGRRVDALALHQYEAVACGGSKEAPKRGVGAAVGQAA